MSDPLSTLIQLSLAEDIGSGDVTTAAIIDPVQPGKALLRAKAPLVVAGLDIARHVFLTVDSTLRWSAPVSDGTACARGETLATIDGCLASMLTAERTALNFLQRLSGVATLTARFVAEVHGQPVKILDTRKTTPGWRALEKYAVQMGGGTSHRLGLYDRYLIKNNHSAAAGSIGEALVRVKKQRRSNLLIEVEARTLADVREALQHDIDIIMLDNMSVEEVHQAVQCIAKKVKIEVSGNITLQSVRSYAETGVDFISVGALTHSAPAADIHLVI